MKIEINSADEGFQKVKFNHFLRARYGYSIGEAKKMVDQILEGQTILLDIDNTDREIFEQLLSFKLKINVYEE